MSASPVGRTPVIIDRSQTLTVCVGCRITSRDRVVLAYRLPYSTLTLCARCLNGIVAAALDAP